MNASVVYRMPDSTTFHIPADKATPIAETTPTPSPTKATPEPTDAAAYAAYLKGLPEDQLESIGQAMKQLQLILTPLSDETVDAFLAFIGAVGKKQDLPQSVPDESVYDNAILLVFSQEGMSYTRPIMRLWAKSRKDRLALSMPRTLT